MSTKRMPVVRLISCHSFLRRETGVSFLKSGNDLVLLAFQSCKLIFFGGQVAKDLPHDRRYRGFAFRCSHPRPVISIIIHRNCDIFHLHRRGLFGRFVNTEDFT